MKEVPYAGPSGLREPVRAQRPQLGPDANRGESWHVL